MPKTCKLNTKIDAISIFMREHKNGFKWIIIVFFRLNGKWRNRWVIWFTNGTNNGWICSPFHNRTVIPASSMASLDFITRKMVTKCKLKVDTWAKNIWKPWERTRARKLQQNVFAFHQQHQHKMSLRHSEKNFVQVSFSRNRIL